MSTIESSITHRDWTGIAPYPDPAIHIHDPQFTKYKINNTAVERLYTGARWTEGPVWFGDHNCLLFSDIPNNRILRYSATDNTVREFRRPSNYANGNFRDAQGRLISCEHDTRRVTRTDYDGTIHTIADHFENKPLNGPNDLCTHLDGSVWFTDPGYGTLYQYEGHWAKHELPACVYRLNTSTMRLTVVIDDMAKPNGLCFSPDYSLLYVVESGFSHDSTCPRVIYVYNVDGDKVTHRDVFVDMKPGGSDGIRTDVYGNLWAAAGWADDGYNGVHCFSPNGHLIGQIHLPEPCANICFGGTKRNRLFMTASQSLYAVYLETVGA